MDKNAIDLALLEIQHMVSVAIDAAENLSVSDTDSDVCQMSYEHTLLDSAPDVVTQLKEGERLNRPARVHAVRLATVVPSSTRST